AQVQGVLGDDPALEEALDAFIAEKKGSMPDSWSALPAISAPVGHSACAELAAMTKTATQARNNI
ncbi:MAG: hypothetical protein P8X51_10020, partial [Maritimibacter sp.]